MQSQHNARATLARLWGNADKDSCGGGPWTARHLVSENFRLRPKSCVVVG